MRAMVFDKYGDSDVLHEVEWPNPAPRSGEVLLRVRAAGVNPIDWKLRSGMLKMIMPLNLPKVLGFEVCGTVVRLGEGVCGLVEGETVHGMVDVKRQGACATHVCVPAGFLTSKPAGMTDGEAASIPLAGLTALQGLRNKAKLQSADRVLVVGASGGVGMFAVQIATAMGATVTGVCSSRNVDFVRSLGAVNVIAYDKESYDDAGPFDVVLDAVGARSFFKAKRMLAKNGRYVSPVPTVGNLASQLMGPMTPVFNGGRCSYGVMVKPSGDDVRYLNQLYADGRLKTHIENTYPLSELARAHERSATGRVVGKLVIEIGPVS